MKTLTGVIALVLALLFGASNGVIAAEQKNQPTSVEKKQPATGEKKTVDKALPILTKVKVLEVNDSAKTITVMVKGKAFTFDAKKLKSLPKPGELIGMWGDPTGDPTGQRLVCAVVECDMGWGSGPCIKCFDYGNL
jgi:hypothetical protein